MAVAADGAESTLRQLAGIEVEKHDYHQRGVVAYVDSDLPNQATARQRFLPGGPLALLPVAERRSSIVWTLPEDEAARVLALDEDSFNRELTRAFARPANCVLPRRVRRSRCAASWPVTMWPAACWRWAMPRMWCIRWPGRA